MTKTVLGTSEVAKILHVSENTIRAWDLKGIFRCAYRTFGSEKRRGIRKYYLEDVLAELDRRKRMEILQSDSEKVTDSLKTPS